MPAQNVGYFSPGMTVRIGNRSRAICRSLPFTISPCMAMIFSWRHTDALSGAEHLSPLQQYKPEMAVKRSTFTLPALPTIQRSVAASVAVVASVDKTRPMAQ